ncbi:hypothetical protein VUR80DRAFT_250 [Thermomyces stellatus]
MTGGPPSDPPTESRGSEDSLEHGNSGRAVGSGSSRDDHLPRRIVNSAASLSSSMLRSRSIGSLRPEEVGLADKSIPGPSSSSNAGANGTLDRHGFGTSAISRSRPNDTSDRDERSEAGFQEFLGHPPPTVDHGAFAIGRSWRDGEPSRVQYRTVENEERRDGEEVTAFLADPSSLQFKDNIDFGSLPAQLPRLRAALLGDGVPSSIWDNLLNFWPVADEDLRPSKSAWLAQWNDVLTRYTDEVWGELATDARQAKEEVEAEAHGDQGDGHGLQSLRRLRQILAHLRGS